MSDNTSESSTSENTHCNYVKGLVEYGVLKVYILSSVIASEPDANLQDFKIDLILKKMFKKKLDTRLVLEVENLEEKLIFKINIDNESVKLPIKRLIMDELKLKGKYCSEIFNIIDDQRIPQYLVMFDDKKCDKLSILPNRSPESGSCVIGDCNYKSKFLQQLKCSESRFKVKDVFFLIDIRDENIFEFME